MIGGLQFLVSTGVEKPSLQTRKLIRSHVMLGKNLGKTFPPRRRQSKKAQDMSSSDLPSESTSNSDEELLQPSASSAISSHLPLPVTFPRKLGSDVSTICFADATDPVMVEVVLQCELRPGRSLGNRSPT